MNCRLQCAASWSGRVRESLDVSAVAEPSLDTARPVNDPSLIHRGFSVRMNGPISKLARCAVYTRKSTEYNLDLAFNSLDAQREACEAYIKSQAHEGWRLIPDPLRRWRILRRLAGTAGAAAAVGRCSGEQDRHRAGLQGRPADPLAR